MKINLFAKLALLGLFSISGHSAQDLPRVTDHLGPALPGQPTPVGEAAILHDWPTATILGFDARGRLLICDSARRQFEMHDLAATPSTVFRWSQPEGEGRVVSGALSRDRRTLATVSEVDPRQSRIRLWNAETGKPVGPEFAASDVAHVAFSPDGTMLAGVVARDGTIRLWDVATGDLRWSAPLSEPMQTTWTGLEFSPNGQHLVARNSFGFQFWDVMAHQVAGRGNRVFLLAVSPDWKRALGFNLGASAPWPPRTGLLDIDDPGKPVPAVKTVPDDVFDSMEMGAFGRDGRSVAVATGERTVRVWDTKSGAVTHQTPPTEGRIVRLLLSPDNRRLATYEVDLSRQRSTLHGKVRLWDLAGGRPLGPARPHAGMFWDWQFDPDSRHLVISVAHENGGFGAQLWQLPESDSPKPDTAPTGQPDGAAAAGQTPKPQTARSGSPPGRDRTPRKELPRIGQTIYSADLKSWPVHRAEHGATSFEGGAYVLRPRTNTWIGPGHPVNITPLEGDFVLELRFRIDERKPSAALSVRLADMGDIADYVEVDLSVWNDAEVAYSVDKGTIRNNFYVNRDESICTREPAPKAVATHDWKAGGRIALEREGGSMRVYANDSLLREFPVPRFVVRNMGLGVAFESVVAITSIEARRP